MDGKCRSTFYGALTKSGKTVYEMRIYLNSMRQLSIIGVAFRRMCSFMYVNKSICMRLIVLWLLIFVGAGVLGCRKPLGYRLLDNEFGTACGSKVKIDPTAYQNSFSDKVNIQTVSISGNCLKITFSAGGCNSASWQPKLLDRGVIAESYPPQRYLRLTLITGQECKALFTKTVYFDIEPVRVDEAKKVYLNIDGYSEAIMYSY